MKLSWRAGPSHPGTQVPQSLIPGRVHSHSPELQVPRSPAPLTLTHSRTSRHLPHCRLWLVTRTLGLRTGPPSLFTWLDSQLTKRVGRQTASCVCEDISRQDSLSSKTNPGCGWSTSRGRNSKGMKWEWGWGGDRTRQEPASLCFCLPTHQFPGHAHPLPRCSAKHTGATWPWTQFFDTIG